MTTALIVFFMAAGLILYAVFGGADFGAGIWESLTPRRDRPRTEALVNRAIGPVWEANHVWIILVLVILFNAFPQVHRLVSIHLHLPLSLLLLGITLRGTAFVCRYYDAFKDESQKIYAWFFRVSSVLTPFVLGVTAAAMASGVPANAATYADAYVWPWLTPFGAAVGLFACVLFAYVAAVFLVGETADEELKALFRRRAAKANGAAVVAGLLVFAAAWWTGVPFAAAFFGHPVALGAVVVVTLLAGLTHRLLKTDHVMLMRTSAATQVALILIAWFATQYPVLLHVHGAENLTFYAALGPPATIKQMLTALVVGAIIIFPSLGYLYFVFKIAK